MNWLNQIFSGRIGLNGIGIAGVSGMVLGALIAILGGRSRGDDASRRPLIFKTIGLLLCALSALVTILYGK